MRWQPIKSNGLDDALRETLTDPAEIGFEAPHHDRLKFLGSDFNAARKALRSSISGRDEKLFEWPLCGVADRKSRCAARQIAHSPRDLAVDRVACAACRSRVMGLIQDQECAGPEISQKLSQSGDIRLIRHKTVREDEPRQSKVLEPESEVRTIDQGWTCVSRLSMREIIASLT